MPSHFQVWSGAPPGSRLEIHVSGAGAFAARARLQVDQNGTLLPPIPLTHNQLTAGFQSLPLAGGQNLGVMVNIQYADPNPVNVLVRARVRTPSGAIFQPPPAFQETFTGTNANSEQPIHFGVIV
jgi:hypothetical protein